ncbi:hypothetical protein DAPPUDRAFT_333991 [Daphnia pulex]|uniref:HAT C-terminal dimerisation domain-containing protein n=1 Tax=Daphnia pulex TaxID=6669 RepID=E9HUD9_DAPPU|nr:hypothetical protein DAPPUDRAFT_333991 [Daphnia pulex]|eukprot:EFX64646.1 hypothetical protein DAPPUDRAFT_333991 [Daphnia pulex]
MDDADALPATSTEITNQSSSAPLKATSAASERAFTVGKDIFGISRMSLKPETVKALICLRPWYKAGLVVSLQQALALEAKFQPKLQLLSTASNTGESGEITCAMRNGAAHVLPCLKVWYDLPSAFHDLIFLLDALNMMDRFMSRMKARPKHLSCIAISSFHLEACQWVERVKQNKNEASSIQSPLQVVPEPQYMVTISQCKFTAGDINRMEKIVEALSLSTPEEEPVTTLTFLNLYHSLLSTPLVHHRTKLHRNFVSKWVLKAHHLPRKNVCPQLSILGMK